MLEGLDCVDWAHLNHAYGSATDVPDMIRALASPDTATRHAAYDALYGTILHQGSVYAATGSAVPFLIELLTEESVEEKARLLALLRYLSNGHTDRQTSDGVDGNDEASAPPHLNSAL